MVHPGLLHHDDGDGVNCGESWGRDSVMKHRHGRRSIFRGVHAFLPVRSMQAKQIEKNLAYRIQ